MISLRTDITHSSQDHKLKESLMLKMGRLLRNTQCLTVIALLVAGQAVTAAESPVDTRPGGDAKPCCVDTTSDPRSPAPTPPR
jgi:hypothetical protein